MDLANEIRKMVQRRELAERARAEGATVNTGTIHWELDTLTSLSLVCQAAAHHHPEGPVARALVPLLDAMTSTLRAHVREGRRIASVLEVAGVDLPHTEGIPNKDIVSQLRDLLGVYD